jgi:hypothetical protein
VHLVHVLAPFPDLAIRRHRHLDAAHGDHGGAEPVHERVLVGVLVHVPAQIRVRVVKLLIGGHDPAPLLDVLEVGRVELGHALLVQDDGRVRGGLRARVLEFLQKVFGHGRVDRLVDPVADVVAVREPDRVRARQVHHLGGAQALLLERGHELPSERKSRRQVLRRLVDVAECPRTTRFSGTPSRPPL